MCIATFHSITCTPRNFHGLKISSEIAKIQRGVGDLSRIAMCDGCINRTHLEQKFVEKPFADGGNIPQYLRKFSPAKVSGYTVDLHLYSGDATFFFLRMCAM